MKKYIISLVLSIVLGGLLFLFAFDQSGFSYLLLFPLLFLFGLPLLLFKMFSKISYKIKYWDLLTFLLWGIIEILYSNFLWGNHFWYSNFMFINQILSSFLFIVPLIMLVYVIINRRMFRTRKSV